MRNVTTGHEKAEQERVEGMTPVRALIIRQGDLIQEGQGEHGLLFQEGKPQGAGILQMLMLMLMMVIKKLNSMV
jgi:hypothetical protein